MISPNIILGQSLFSKWEKGLVTLVDGEAFEATLFYKLETEELQIKTDREIKKYKPKDVVSFEIMDRDTSEVYYSLPFDLYDEKSPVAFFQLLKEMNDFWFLSKKQPEVTTTGGAPGGSMVMGSYQPEILFFLTQEGKIEIFSSSDPGLTKKTLLGNKSYVKMELLRSLTDPYFEKLQDYANQNHLHFERKKDLLEILNYYQSLQY